MLRGDETIAPCLRIPSGPLTGGPFGSPGPFRRPFNSPFNNPFLGPFNNPFIGPVSSPFIGPFSRPFSRPFKSPFHSLGFA